MKAAQTKLGKVLVDATGRTLYLFEKDRARTSTCAGACVSFWPPLLTAGAPEAGAGGVKAALLGQIMRRDGTHQVTYAGHPLYRYAGDAARGQTNGEGSHTFGAAWYVVAPSGKKIDDD